MMMSNSSRHNNNDPYNHENRQTFVLKCDKPRYDGGVEVDLERYFGRKLQPNMNQMKRARLEKKLLDLLAEGAEESENALEAEAFISELSFHEVEDVKLEEAGYNQQCQSLTFSQLSSMALDKANLDRAINRRHPMGPYGADSQTMPAMKTDSKWSLIRQVLLQGPLQVAISLAGIVTTMVAMASIGLGTKHVSLKQQSLELMKDCSAMFWKGWLNTVLIPFKTVQVAFAKA
jgi:hypothetical protein